VCLLFLGRDGVVLVATDAAARGIDIPAVTHVVQADFAASAVDFLHRVRTGNSCVVPCVHRAAPCHVWPHADAGHSVMRCLGVECTTA